MRGGSSTKLVCCAAIGLLWSAPLAAQAPEPTPESAAVAPAPDQPAEQDPPAPHVHTGWATLLKDSAGDFLAFPKRKSTWVLLAAGGAAALAAHPADSYVESHIVGNQTADRVFVLGKVLGSTQVEVASAVGLWVVGRYVVAPAANESQTNKYSEVGFDLIRAEILSQALTQGMKHAVGRARPTGECCSFSSGHSATAFAVAAVLERHFGYRASWPALAAATYVAASRLVDNRHFLSDVAFGAGLGMASGWTVVGTRGRSGFTLQPVPVRGGMMIAVMRVPDDVK